MAIIHISTLPLIFLELCCMFLLFSQRTVYKHVGGTVWFDRNSLKTVIPQ